MARFCTQANGYRLGYEGAELTNVCPDPLALAYLDGYQSGYSIYLTRLEIDATEGAIESKSAELEHIWSMLDVANGDLSRGDLDSGARARRLAQSASLTTRQRQITREIDELEADLSARKSQLSEQLSEQRVWQRQAVANNH